MTCKFFSLSNFSKIFLSLIFALYTSDTRAGTVAFSGKVPYRSGFKVKIRCALWVEDKLLQPDSNGKFSFITDVQHPTEFTVLSGNNYTSSCRLFCFGKEQITINVFNDFEQKIEILGASGRSTAFNMIEDRLFGECADALRKSVNIEEGLKAVRNGIRGIPGIGNDSYTEMIAECAGLVLLTTLYDTTGQPLYDVSKRNDFKRLVSHSEILSGIELFNNLRWPIFLEHLKRQHKEETAADDVPDFLYLLRLLERERKNVPAKIYVNTRYGILMLAQPAMLPEKDRGSWLREARAFGDTYSGYTFTEFLESQLKQVVHSQVGLPAPSFMLMDINGMPVSLSDYKGRYVLLDIWGSWCLPCRKSNKELISAYPDYNPEQLVFLSVAYDQDIAKWKKAIKEDGLQWKQLLYSDEFLKDYNIFCYPTLVLISPDQKVVDIDYKFNKDKLDALITKGTEKYDRQSDNRW